MSSSFPPTILVVHPKEKRSKCSIELLRGREGFVFWKFPQRGREPLDGYVRLGLDGPQLTPEDASRGLLVLDATWRLAQRMEQEFDEIPVRSLGPWQTAYPRKSKLFTDPSAGLATIEAVYAAYVQLGRKTSGLLDHYHWATEFIECNQALIRNE